MTCRLGVEGCVSEHPREAVVQELAQVKAKLADALRLLELRDEAVANLLREAALATDLLGRKQDEIARLRGELERVSAEAVSLRGRLTDITCAMDAFRAT